MLGGPSLLCVLRLLDVKRIELERLQRTPCSSCLHASKKRPQGALSRHKRGTKALVDIRTASACWVALWRDGVGVFFPLTTLPPPPHGPPAVWRGAHRYFFFMGMLRPCALDGVGGRVP